MDDLFAGCERPEAPAGSSPAAALDQKALIAAKAAKALSGAPNPKTQTLNAFLVQLFAVLRNAFTVHNKP